MALRRLLLIFLLVNSRVKAADPYPIQYLGIEHGLSNNAVTCIYQDHNGFMWFGTYDGLNRYDGYDFKVFRNKFNDTNSLANNRVSTITEDKQHNLWIGTTEIDIMEYYRNMLLANIACGTSVPNKAQWFSNTYRVDSPMVTS